MEEKKTKSNVLGITIGILVSIICAIGGFILGDKYFEYEKNITNKEEKNINDIQKEENVEQISQLPDEKYKIYLNNLKNELSKSLKTNNSRITLKHDSMIWNQGYEFTITDNYDLLMTINEEKLKNKYNNYKIDSNVLSMYIISTGNGGYNSLFYITANGIVKHLCIECIDNEELNIKEDNLKNITSIIQESSDDGWDATFIDIEGKVFTDYNR